MAARLAALLLLAPLAGCLAAETTGDPLDPDACPAEGCAGPAPLPAPEAAPEASDLRFDGVLVASVATPVVAANPASSPEQFLFAFDVPEGAATVTVTLLWNATQATSRSLQLVVETAEEMRTVTGGEAESPLVVSFDGAEHAGQRLQTRTFVGGPAGLAKDQPFHVHVRIEKTEEAAASE